MSGGQGEGHLGWGVRGVEADRRPATPWLPNRGGGREGNQPRLVCPRIAVSPRRGAVWTSGPAQLRCPGHSRLARTAAAMKLPARCPIRAASATHQQAAVVCCGRLYWAARALERGLVAEQVLEPRPAVSADGNRTALPRCVGPGQHAERPAGRHGEAQRRWRGAHLPFQLHRAPVALEVDRWRVGT